MKLVNVLKYIHGEVSIYDVSIDRVVYRGIAGNYDGVCDYDIMGMTDGDGCILINVYRGGLKR